MVQGADLDSVWTSYLAADEIGNRMDAYRGYLEPVREECTNLEVIEGATVTKLLLNADSNKTTGIEYQQGEQGAPQVTHFTCNHSFQSISFSTKGPLSWSSVLV